MKTNHWKRRLQKINRVSIGSLILIIPLLLLSLGGCTKTEIQYVELPRKPITCIDTMKTPEDMLKCLNEYDANY